MLAQVRGWVLLVMLPATALAFSLHFVSFHHPKQVLLAAGTALCLVLALAERRGIASGVRAFLPLILFVLWAAVTGSLRGVAVDAAMDAEAARLFTLLLAGILAWDRARETAWRERLLDAAGGAGVAAAVLALLQYGGLLPWLFPAFPSYPQPMYATFGNQDLLGGYLAMALPALAFGAFRASPADESASGPAGFAVRAAGCGVMAFALLLAGSRTAWLAALVGAGVTALWPNKAVSGKRLGILLGVLAAAVLVSVAAAPDATWGRLAATFGEDDAGGRLRLWFWAGTARMAAKWPWTGCGLGNYAYWSPLFLGKVLWSPGGGRYMHNTEHTQHAHCDALEVLAETGIVGLALCGWMLLRLARRRGPEWGPLAAFAVFGLFNAAVYSPPHALLAVLLAASLMARNGDEPGPVRFSWVGLVPLALVLGVFVWESALNVWWPSWLLRRAERIHLSGKAPFGAYEAVPKTGYLGGRAAEHHGAALLEESEFQLAVLQFMMARDSLDTGSVYLGLGAAQTALGEREKARRSLEACLLRWPSDEDAWVLRVRVAEPGERDALIERASRWLGGAAIERVRAEARGVGVSIGQKAASPAASGAGSDAGAGRNGRRPSE